ncbi:tyrosine-protein kinase Src42A-like isoform X1 [Symsagittifera roscoffensis]|uniref:tyrosine-protein kinase Src42A-like isoform X1 n=2 Tax=Symsagittifera roscoffensis TaxID=84072 RepID=UPI00307BA577
MQSGTPGMNNRDSPSSTNKNVFIAKFDYTCQTDDEPPFKKGDLLEAESTMGDCWMATHKANGKRGYIPSNYVESYISHRAEPWFMEEITRLSAECMLRECAKGTFLVRPAESRSNKFSLSVKDNSEVKHYRIRMNDEGLLFIDKRSTFPNLVQLVEHCKQHCHGLCVKLVASIEQNEGPVRTLQSLSKSHEVNWVISLKDLQFGTKLGSGQFGEVFRGSWNGNKEVAIKTLKQRTMDKEDFRRESNIMKKLQHKNLVALYGVCIEALLIVTELAKHGNLLEFFKKKLNQ